MGLCGPCRRGRGTGKARPGWGGRDTGGPGEHANCLPGGARARARGRVPRGAWCQRFLPGWGFWRPLALCLWKTHGPNEGRETCGGDAGAGWREKASWASPSGGVGAGGRCGLVVVWVGGVNGCVSVELQNPQACSGWECVVRLWHPHRPPLRRALMQGVVLVRDGWVGRVGVGVRGHEGENDGRASCTDYWVPR